MTTLEGVLMFTIILIMVAVTFAAIRWHEETNKRELAWMEKLEKAKKDSVATSKAVIAGNVNEQLAPIFPNFPYNVKDVKHLGSVVDFIVFDGLDQVRNGGKVNIKIIFADCKTNTASLSKVQRAVKEAVEQGRFSFEEWNIRDGVLNNK